MAFKNLLKHVDGKHVGTVVLFALSTCPWCKKTKKLLDEMGLEYDYVDVDFIQGIERNEVKNELDKIGADFSFPLIVVDNKRMIHGFDERAIRMIGHD